MGDDEHEAPWRAAFGELSRALPGSVLQTVLENSADALVLLQVPEPAGGGPPELVLGWMNPTARRVQGASDDWLGRPLAQLWPEVLTSGTRDLLLEALATDHIAVGSLEWSRPHAPPVAHAYRAVALGPGILLWALRSVEDQVEQARALGERTAELHRALQAQRAALRLLEEQASTIYDEVVQALVGARMGLELGDDPDRAIAEIDRALAAAKQISTGGDAAGRLTTRGTEPAADVDQSGRIRTLICDDDALIRDLLARALARTDDFVVVGQAGDGRDAVERLDELGPDLVLLDLNMPVMSGMEALPLIRRRRPDAVVVVVSGLLEGTAREQALAAGASAYIEKGASVFELVEQLRVAVTEARAGA